MDLRFTPEELAFRDEVRAFFRANLPDSIRTKLVEGKHLAKDDIVTWQRILNAKGWAVANWPVEWGGTGWTPVQQYIFQEELQQTPAPQPLGFGVTMVGPVIIAFGSDAQKKRHLPAIANLDVWWCQGFSEPDAGSDLLSLRTTAIRQGEHFILNGRKLWITRAHDADMMFALARIEAAGNRRQQGLSFLLLDMRTPGITVNPFRMIDGVPHVNEVLLENVRVPVENLVGEQGKGWVYARFLLDRERSLVAQLPGLRRLVASLRKTLQSEIECGTPLIENPSYRLKLSQYEAELGALEFLELRFLHVRDDDPNTQVLASILKLRGTDLRQRVSEALWEVYGDRGLEFSLCLGAEVNNERGTEPVHWSAVNHLFQRAATIAGGTSEIQRNIIAGVSLGL